MIESEHKKSDVKSTNKAPDFYAKGFKEGWDEAVNKIENRITKEDVFNSHIQFAWDKVREMLYSDDYIEDTKCVHDWEEHGCAFNVKEFYVCTKCGWEKLIEDPNEPDPEDTNSVPQGETDKKVLVHNATMLLGLFNAGNLTPEDLRNHRQLIKDLFDNPEVEDAEKVSWKYPEIRDAVNERRNKYNYLWKAKKEVAEELGISETTLDSKYYARCDKDTKSEDYRLMPGFDHYEVQRMLKDIKSGKLTMERAKKITESYKCHLVEHKDVGIWEILSPSKTQSIGLNKDVNQNELPDQTYTDPRLEKGCGKKFEIKDHLLACIYTCGEQDGFINYLCPKCLEQDKSKGGKE